MRDHWEVGKGGDLEAPASLTERQLRSLRRRSGLAVLALLLALFATGAVVWSVLAGPEGRAAILDLKDRILGEREASASDLSSAPGGAAPTSGGAADSTLIPPPASDSIPVPVPPSDGSVGPPAR